MQKDNLLPLVEWHRLQRIEFRHEAEKDCAEWTKQGLTVDEAYIKTYLARKMQYNIDYLKM